MLPRQLAEKLLRFASRHAGVVAAVWLGLGAIATIGVLRLEIETSTASVLDRTDDRWKFYRESLSRFGGDEVIVLALRGDSAYDKKVLGRLAAISRRLEAVSGVRRVDSLATVPLIRVSEGGVVDLSPAIGSGTLPDGEDWAKLKRQIARDRIAPGTLISDDGLVAGVNVFLRDGLHGEYERVVEEIERVAEEADAAISGVPVFRVETNRRTFREIATFVPLTIGTIVILLYAVFRDARMTLVPLATACAGTWILAGIMGLAGVPFTLTTMILPSVLLALGCAYVMHMLVAVTDRCQGERVEEKLVELSTPIALSGLTTALGLGAMYALRIDSIRYVALFGAIGVGVSVLAALTVAPALLCSLKSRDVQTGWPSWVGSRGSRVLWRLGERWPRTIVLGWLVALLGVGYGVSRVVVETDVTSWFQEETWVRRSYETIRHALAGISPMNVVIEAPAGGAISRPDVIRAIAGLDRFLEERLDVGETLSVADPILAIHRGFYGGEVAGVPPSQELIDQYLLLLESVPQLGDLITEDRQYANVMIRSDGNGSQHLLETAAAAERWWEENGPEGFRAQTTGIMFEFARAGHEIAWGQVRGLGIAFGAIAIVLLAIFRSPLVAVVAMVPNAIPVAAAFGIMGLAGVRLDAGTVLIGNLALGIAVDDTIHLVTAYQRELDAGGRRDAAVRTALRSVLPAVVLTTVIVGLGFLVLGLSEFTFVANLGIVTAGVMGLCLAADVNLLPVLLAGNGPLSASRQARRSPYPQGGSRGPSS